MNDFHCPSYVDWEKDLTNVSIFMSLNQSDRMKVAHGFQGQILNSGDYLAVQEPEGQYFFKIILEGQAGVNEQRLDDEPLVEILTLGSYDFSRPARI